VRLDPGPSLAVRNHSPDGFEWGYWGSGPSQLALALILDATGSRELAESFYQTFKEAHVGKWGERWEISARAIWDWLGFDGTNARQLAPEHFEPNPYTPEAPEE
jgi:hypothetical protein